MEVLGFRAVDLGAAALVGLVVLMVLRGQLITRRQHEDMIADKDRQIAAEREEKITWREAHSVSEEGRRAAEDHASEMVELSKFATGVLAALPRAAGEVSSRADVDQASAGPPAP
ncbi:hypothetical protein [Streptomyces tauricus]